MNEYLTFDAKVQPLVWGKSTFTIVRLPQTIAEEFLAIGAKRVEGEMNDHPVNLALTKAPPVDGVFLWAGKSLLDRIGVRPGENFEVRLRMADTDGVEVPLDVLRALRSAGVAAQWEGLTPGKRRGLLYKIESAKRAETRASRISALAEFLKDEP